MHLPPGLRPGPRWGSLQCCPRPLSWIWGRAGASSEKEGGEDEKRGKGREGYGKGGKVAPPRNGRPGSAAGSIFIEIEIITLKDVILIF